MTRSLGLRAVPGALALLALAACASTPPPSAELALSSAALTRADGAGAAELAPAELRMARAKLERAQAALASKDHDQALQMAQQSEVDARLAEAKSRAAKARKTAEELQEGNRVLREEMGRKTPAVLPAPTTPRTPS
ncbi:DUF4398 domain-containing protein [Roseateles cavernae]|uniref:DUF4398 domain-containing protein n=1 Tax=Roseateles cavernae TaxID=3153578 RepID=UPI0032E465B0